MIARLIALSLVLLLTPAAHAQKSQSNASANQAWPAFWHQFSDAINRKDSAALLKMMPSDFSDGGGGMSAAEWLEYINANEQHGSWKDLQRSVARGTVISKEWSNNKVLTRITRDKHYYFEFRKDKKWWFAGVAGD